MRDRRLESLERAGQFAQRARHFLGLRLWNLRKARFGLEAIKTFYLDRKYGGPSGGVIESPYQALGSYETVSTDYTQLGRIFDGKRFDIQAGDVLVDVGCGKGRVINHWLQCGYRNKMIGIELNEDVARATRTRLEPYRNVTIIAGNVLDRLPEDGTVFYLFNPFDEKVMAQFAERLVARFYNKKNIRVIYYRAQSVAVFEDNPLWMVEALHTGTDHKVSLIRFRQNDRS